MATTYEKIATTTLGSAASFITFSSIAATYTDLRLVFVGTSAASGAIVVQFNSDTGFNYSRTYLAGDGSSASSGRASNDEMQLTLYNNLSSTIPSMRTMDIFSYAGSTYKTVLTSESSDYNGSGSTVVAVQMWRNTAAITSIKLTTNGAATYAIGTSATIYGILKA